jgi:hypothetical protein
MRSIVMSAKEILKNEGWTLDVVTTTDTQNFLEENYSDCEMMQYKEGFSINKNSFKTQIKIEAIIMYNFLGDLQSILNPE